MICNSDFKCEYCCEEAKYLVEPDMECRSLGGDDWSLVIKNNKLILDIDFEGTENWSEIPINFCPICGKNLKGGEKE